MRKMWIMIPLMISCMMLSAYDNRNTDKKGNGGAEEIAFSLDEEESIRNSNLARFGYLTATDDGRIYYTQLDKNAIYVAKGDGSGQKQICDEAGMCLQVEGDYLYYRSCQGGIRRIHTESYEVETLIEENTGEFIIEDGLIYINAPGGFTVYSLDGIKQEVLFDDYEPVLINSSGEAFWFMRVSGEDISVFLEGYLMMYHMEKEEVCTIAENVRFPLLSGSYLCYVDTNTWSRRILDTGTGEQVDLGIYAESAVGNGKDLYFVNNRAIMHWDGERLALFQELEKNAGITSYLYLSKEYLYLCQLHGKYGMNWSCYDLESGESKEF